MIITNTTNPVLALFKGSVIMTAYNVACIKESNNLASFQTKIPTTQNRFYQLAGKQCQSIISVEINQFVLLATFHF